MSADACTVSVDASAASADASHLSDTNVDGRLHIARKPRQYDERDPYYEPYDPYGPGAKVIDDAGDKFADA